MSTIHPLRAAWTIMFSIMLSGCVSTTSMKSPPSEDMRGEEIRLSYFDSPVFESTMRHLLASSADKVTVDTFDSFNVSDVPDIFQEWIERASESGRKVSMVDEADLPRSRGIVEDVASSVFEYFHEQRKKQQEAQWYQPVEHYEIDIVFDTENGAVSRLIFVRNEETFDVQ